MTFDGVAHVRFDGGGKILPVGGPYDRQFLVEEISYCLRKKGALDVVLSHQRWRVRSMGGRCTCCGAPLRTGGCSTGRDREPSCIDCAFAARAGAISRGTRRRRTEA